jgi:hypothetical protein
MPKCASCVDFDNLLKEYNAQRERLKWYRLAALKLAGSQIRLAEVIDELVEDEIRKLQEKAQEVGNES